MTTRVTVINYGPDNVTVKPVDKDGKQMAPLTLVKVNEVKEQYVHQNQNLIIEEVR